MGDDVVVQCEAILVRTGSDARAGCTAHQANARRGLEDIRRKRAALRVELHTEITGFGDPNHLVARFEQHNLRQDSYKDKFFRHVSFSRAHSSARK